MVGVILASVLVGIGAAFVGSRFANEWGTTVIGVGAGVALSLFILTFAKVTIEWVIIISSVVGGAIGGYLGNKFNKLVKCIGTSIIGAFILVRGIAFYVGNWPTTLSVSLLTSTNYYIYGYAGGIVVLSIIGSVV